MNTVSSSNQLAAYMKSTLVPFSGWIADAMVAPSSVSAFLHAATMVTIGIYLLINSW
jgi:multicomponent Na+:H+ antiporter subunit A